MRLDVIDQRIMAMLGENGRFSNVEIAAAVGVSHSTVKKRIDRLVGDGVFRVLGVVNPEKLGFGTSVFLFIKTRPGMTDHVAQILTACPEVYWIGQMTGRYDLMAEIVLRGATEIFDVTAREIAQIPGILTLQTAIATRQTWWRPMEWRPATSGTTTGQTDRWDLPMWRGDGSTAGSFPVARGEVPASEQPDETDMRIIELLQENGRRPAAEIARLTGGQRLAVKNRIDRLLESGVCKVVGVVAPEKLGFRVGAHILIETDPDKAVEIGETLARMHEIAWLCHTTGQFDIMVELHMESTEEIVEFVGRTIAAIPGLRTTEVVFIVRQTGWRPAEWRPDRARTSDWLATAIERAGAHETERWWSEE